MSKINFDKIILLACLLIASVLFYQNQQNYASKLSAKLEEIGKANIKALSAKHFDLRNKYVQHNDADKYGIALSDLFLDCYKEIDRTNSLREAFASIRSFDQIHIYISEDEFWQLKSAEEIMTALLDKFEKIVELKFNAVTYESEFTILTEILDETDESIIFTVMPFESFQIPKGELIATLEGDTLAINSAPSNFCLRAEKVEFKSDMKIGKISESILP